MAALMRELLVRVILEGMLVPLSFLGVDTSARIRSLSVAGVEDGDVAVVTDSAILTTTKYDNELSFEMISRELLKLEDLGGVDDSADKLFNVTRDFLFKTNPDTDSMSSGVLVHGPSDTGKLELSRVVAGELGVHVEEVH